VAKLEAMHSLRGLVQGRSKEESAGDQVILYIGSLAIGLGLVALAMVALIAVVEASWWLIAKATGKEY
jgi:hypothetical protein